MSAARASTMRRKAGPDHSESVGSQSMQFAQIVWYVWIYRINVWISRGQGVSAMINARQPGSLGAALWRGFSMRCPNCGRASLFGRYLKVVPECPVCGEDFSHQRADDFPAYIVIFVLGHLVIPAVLVVEEVFAPPLWLDYLIWLPFIIFGA